MDTRREVSRRHFLQVSAGLLGSGALASLLSACSSGPAPAGKPAEAPPAAAPAAPAAGAPAAAPVAAGASPAAQSAPAAASKPAGQGDRLTVGVGQWGIETPFAWRTSQSEKTLWDVMYDPLIMRDPKTFQWVPGLATEWKNSDDYRTWTFKLRQGVKFHGDNGEMTADDVKFTVEQNLKPDSQGGSAPFFRQWLEKIELPDKYTLVMSFKKGFWEVPSHFTQFAGYQNVFSRSYFEKVGEEKAAQMPVGTGPYEHVEGKQGDFHRFRAVANHWRVTPSYKELVIRRVPEAATRLAGIRAGEIDIGQVAGDYLEQARSAGLRIHEVPTAAPYWIMLAGQTVEGKDDYSPQSPWVGDPKDPKAQENALKVRMAMSYAVNKQAIMTDLWKGMGQPIPYSYWYFPFNKGYSQEWKQLPYDVAKAKQLLSEAGVASGFEIRVNPMVFTFANDGNDVMEAVALDWEKVGIKAKRVPEDFGSFITKVRARKTGPTSWCYASPPFDEPSLVWQRGVHTSGAFNILAEGPYDQEIDAILAELNPDKRTQMTSALGTKLYNAWHGVPLGFKTLTWALTKKVGDWPTLQVPLETNYEYIGWTGA
jgi:peptide/nickel transport system substrate-binding protein